ncbi:hypothetical protein EW026_g1922 [Hermanssonia centrifuga]|uniref:Protein HGH1 homolog n=1 Tax=Hermanssonia centrifuga TaxID=98765 RepID=A0A4S4KPW3_9APHY|nr:hypothetical protein EW026_g1922 [Hermanssonia centrifuga]
MSAEQLREATAHDAFRALINLSDNAQVAISLSEPSFLTFIVAYILNAQSILADLASMLLSNLTSSAATCATVLSMKVQIFSYPESPSKYLPVQSRSGTCPAPIPYPEGEPTEVSALPLLIEAFVQGASVDEEDDPGKRLRKGNLNFLSSVFANISIIPSGRMFFLTPGHSDPIASEGNLEYPLSKLLIFTEHKDTIRRGGVASTIKNCAFYTQAHRAMLSPDSVKVTVPPSILEAPGMDLLAYLLLPLAGPEEYDLEEQELLPPSLQFLPETKKREHDPVIRLTHVETLLLLCTTYWAREYLRNHGVYEVIRPLHENEPVDNVSEHIERVVNFLKRDEGSDTKIDDTDNGAKIEAVSDDEDDMIVEV